MAGKFAGRLLFEQRVTRRRYDADYLDRLFLFLPFIQIGAPASVSVSPP